ncbi:SRPBCC family protein [Mucilaginibacter ginsenosidivorax]|uniref:SRPBCC domain-containing protein n=1 Tax=Mucilaginibacter ginsenosidivorax TaxID=862126 RepID=A0A5B8W304_9SPHI|nr:SRPBCC domain-containing protein [Mucilaginibacter ginsenosidivorax]QEC78224.1 SRPBCC domain-containing protein [Mucilaginibacter ginsenosidivorax]
MNNYQKTITVINPANEVYAAITRHIADWWSDDLTGTTAHVGDQYDIAFGKTKKTFSIIEAVPNSRVVWQCDKAHIDMASLKNKAEWVGTKLIWTISADNQGTTLNFLHEGLNQSFECYTVCEAGWDYFIGSLRAFLSMGSGTPYRKQQAVSN